MRYQRATVFAAALYQRDHHAGQRQPDQDPRALLHDSSRVETFAQQVFPKLAAAAPNVPSATAPNVTSAATAEREATDAVTVITIVRKLIFIGLLRFLCCFTLGSNEESVYYYLRMAITTTAGTGRRRSKTRFAPSGCIVPFHGVPRRDAFWRSSYFFQLFCRKLLPFSLASRSRR